MTEKSTIGLIINIPEDNGYDINTFREKVTSHLSELLGIEAFIPALAVLKEVEGTTETLLRTTDKQFGVTITATGAWWNEVFRKQNLAEQIIIQYYGLSTKRAKIHYEKNFKTVFTHQITE